LPKYRSKRYDNFHQREKFQDEKTHLVKTHYWNQGVLETKEFQFSSFMDARGFAVTFVEPVHVIKVYNERGELVFQSSRVPQEGIYA
jgi:hypothetical protein